MDGARLKNGKLLADLEKVSLAHRLTHPARTPETAILLTSASKNHPYTWRKAMAEDIPKLLESLPCMTAPGAAGKTGRAAEEDFEPDTVYK